MKETYTAAVTLLAILTYVVMGVNVGRARTKYGVKAPAVTGNEIFERAYRVQMNTLEQLAVFLPVLWLYAVFVSDIGAAVSGLIWIAARLIYMVSYMRDPSTRRAGAVLTMLVQVGLFLGAAYGVARGLL
jgi:glutathione S-transferase